MAYVNRNGAGQSTHPFLVSVARIADVGLALGGFLFASCAIYLIWNTLSGAIAGIPTLDPVTMASKIGNVQMVTTVMTVTGIIFSLSLAARFYFEEALGYGLLIGWALFYLGIPQIAQSSGIPQTETSGLQAQIIGQFKLIGIVNMVLAIPFIGADIWLRLQGYRTIAGNATSVPPGERGKWRSRNYSRCWEMNVCREEMRRHCPAYRQKQNCWKIRSGCLCNEDLMLRARSNEKLARQPETPRKPSRRLTPDEAARRCRQCSIYQAHQEQKHRLISPLVFPVTLLIVWALAKPVRMVADKVAEFGERFAQALSLLPRSDVPLGNEWLRSSASAQFVEWLFLICLALLLVTALLRLVEWAIYRKGW